MELSEAALVGFFDDVMDHLGERQRRLVAGALARALGRGGQARVVEASGLSSHTLWRGVKEIREGVEPSGRQRAEGAGDKAATVKQPGLLEALDELVDPGSWGDPGSPLRWTAKSTYELAGVLQDAGYVVSAELVRRLLHSLNYSLQASAKQNEGSIHPDRDGQFRYLNAEARERLGGDEPVISVGTKMNELVGNFAHGGSEWQRRSGADRLKVHDFLHPVLGRAVPYGTYDLANDEGWAAVGQGADISEFAVNAIARWWETLGSVRFPQARRLLITADVGGSNRYPVRAWQCHLQRLADGTGLEITVCHYPPGTSKWNRIEHRFFSFITMNRRGSALMDLATIVELIGSTTTTTGLTIQAHHDPSVYGRGIKIAKVEMD